MIDICLAGTGGTIPLKNRWLSCCFIEYLGNAALIDCGEGTQIALSQSNCKLSKLDLLLITHFHADHISGLPGLLLSLGNTGKLTPLKIYGPSGIIDVVNKLSCICPVLPYELEIIELDITQISQFEWNGILVSSLPLQHNIPCLGFSFVLKRKPVFNPEKAIKAGVPQEYWKKLHAGEIILIDGKEITVDMVSDSKRKPIKISYITDSSYFDGIISFVKDSDLLISEGMYGEDDNAGKMIEKGHMVFSDSANLAVRSNVKQLWLTHYSPALTDTPAFEKSVKNIFTDTIISVDGQKITLK